MAKVDNIIQQIRDAKAAAISQNGGITANNSASVKADTKKILQASIAAQQSAKKDFSGPQREKPNYLAPTTPKGVVAGQLFTDRMAELRKPAAQKLKEAQAVYDAYVQSDEYKQNTVAYMKELTDDWMNATILGYDGHTPTPKKDPKEQELKAMVDRARAELDAWEDARTHEANMAEIAAMSEEDRAQLEQYIKARETQQYTASDIGHFALVEKEKESKKPLVEKYGDDRVDQLAEIYDRHLHAQQAEQTIADAKKAVNDGWISATAHNLAGIAARAFGGPLALQGRAVEQANRTGQYRTLEAYTPGDQVSLYGNTVMQQTAQNIAGEDGGTGRKVLSVGYQGIMTLADSISRSLALGPAGGAALAATGSFSQTVSEATKQGASPQQAVTLGVAKAGMEYISEKIPMDEVFKLAKGGKTNVLIQAFKQAGIEITTEELSLFGSMAAEAAILQEKSSYKQRIGDLVANGVSYKEAKAQADKDVWNEVLQTAAVSGFAGFLSGGGAAIVGNLTANNAPEVTEEVQQAGPSTEQLLEGIQDMTPAPAPLTEEQQHFDNAAAIANGVQPSQMQAAEDTSTTINTDPGQHTPQEQAVIDEYQNSVDENLVEYIEAVKNNPGQKMPRYPLNNVSDRAAADIKQLTGVDVSGNKTQIEPRIIEHIIKDHGENGVSDHSMRDVNDIARIQYVIDNYDSIEHGGTSSAYVYQNSHGRNAHAQTVVMKKKVNGTYFVVEAVPDTKKKTVYITSAYMSKDGTQKAVESLSGDANAPRITPENATKNPTASDIIVAESGAGVNENSVNPEAMQSLSSEDTRNQSAQGKQIKGTGAAERNFSGAAAYEDMLSDGNLQRQRPGTVRDVEMPKKDSDGRHVTEFAGNAVSSGVTPDPMADAIKSLVGDKKLSFDTRTNKQSLQNAADAIKVQGDTAVIASLHANAESKTVVDGDVEKALVLYAQYANDPDPKSQETAAQIILDMGAIANMSGRNLQLFSLMKRMTPEGQLMTVRKNIEKSVADINKGRSSRKQLTYVPGQKNVDAAKGIAKKRGIEIDEALEQSFLDAKTDEQRQAALDDIYKNVATQIKPTLGEAWDAWRNLAMLGNIKTHGRNYLSTGAFQPYTTVKRTIGAALEKRFLKQEKRTKSVLGASKDDINLLAWARVDATSDNIKKLLGGAGTAGDDVRNAIQDNRKLLPGPLDAVRKKNLDLMEAEDFVFKRSEYGVSLASFLKARGYDSEQVWNGFVPKGVMDEGRQYAIKEAQKATFNDRNALSDAISKLNFKNDGLGAVGNIARKGILPFLKTPANVVKRIIEYNPLSMAKTLITAKGDIDSGRKSAADVIDEVSAGLTGTAAMALGSALAAGMIPGVELVGAIYDEDELREGAQEYSIRIGDKYYSVAWLAPAMIPLFIGANLYNKFSKWETGMDGWDVVQAFVEVGVDTLNPMLELSMLSNLNNFVDNISNEDTAGDKVMVAFLDAATSYFTQGIPTVFGQIEQATEKEKKSTYVNTDNDLEKAVKTTIAGATKRLPGDLYQTTKLDEFGKPVKNSDDWMTRAFDAFLNPFTTSTRKTDEITKEITRLNKAGYDVTPSTAARTISYIDKDGYGHDDVRLTEEQFQKLAQTQGQTAQKLLEDMISSKAYAALTDEQKADAIDTAYLYARKTGEIAAVEDHTGYDQSWFYDVEKGGANEIIRRVLNSSINTSMSDLDTAWDKGYDEETFNRELQTAYDSYQKAPADTKKQVYAEAEGTVKKYIEARDKGISHEEFVAAAENIAKVKGTGSINKDTGKATVRDIDRRQAIANTTGMTEKEIDIVMKVYMADYDPSDESPETTEFKYDYVRHELDLSAKEYAATYRAYLDSDKKAQKISSIMALGYDWDTAYKLYRVYAGSMNKKLIEMYG